MVACARCPYQSNYQLLWREAEDPDVIAVMLRCCAGPELQIRRGADVLLSEIFKTVPAVLARAEELRGAFHIPA
jgi:thymidylate synthase ThyX